MPATAIKESVDNQWHDSEIEQVVPELDSHIEEGLTAQEVTRRQEKYGTNELTGKAGQPLWLKFLLQFNQPLLIILLFAGLVKSLTGSFVNAGVIWGVTTTNAIIAFLTA